VEHTTFKGTTKRSAFQILNELERVGGDLNAFTTKEHTIYHAAVLHEHVGKAISLLSDIVFNSTYPEAEIETEKEVICDEIESYNDSPAELIFDEFENLLFDGSPLGHSILGNSQRVRSFTSADAQRFARRHYRPDNTIFFAYGDVEFERLVKSLTSSIQSIEFPDAFVSRPEGNPIFNTQHVAPKKHHQAHVMIGTKTFAADDERRITLFLLNNILGGPGMNARLNLSLRERRGLVYTVESNMTTYSDTGLWAVYFGCDHHDVKQCQRLVQKELNRMMDHPLSERQLAAAKRQLKGQMAIASDNHEQLALDVARTFLHEHREHHISQLFQQIDAVSAIQIQQLALQLFKPESLKTLII
jgi:predicted Zn-dependent peptidase